MPSIQHPLSIFSPPDSVPSAPPVTTRIQVLPFGELSWENFERLCHRLTELDGNIVHCARYGQQGEAQEGIDIYARQADGRYHCLQAKRHSSFSATKMRDAVDLFLAGSWSARSARLTIAVQASLRSTTVQVEIERLAKALAALGIAFEALDGEGLTNRLRDHSALVDDFFGRPWVQALLGPDVANSLGERLDGNAFARIRSQLAHVYPAQFHFFDPGSYGSISDEDGRPALTLLDRFIKPDMLVRETTWQLERTDQNRTEIKSGDYASSLEIPTTASTRSSESVANRRMRRLSLVEWLADSQRMVILGDAGCGKSTLLRVLAIDLLNSQALFPELAARWGQHIPIYIPFARWASQVAREESAIGIKEIVRRTLQQFVTTSIVDLLDRAIDEHRVLLLVDGLDEWSNEQAALTTLSALVTTVQAHGIPVIVSGRPRGLSRINALPTDWKRGSVAPLSTDQAAAIAGRWFTRYATALPDETDLSDAKLRTDRFMAELARDASLNALAAVPLLLVGLIALALRGQILPRTRGDVYDQLVRILLEVHPVNRATASGDTVSRFQYATDPDQRRAAISRLAFAVRSQTGGAGIELSAARDVLRDYLVSPQGFDFSDSDAAAIAGEILSVNAETQGLLIEKAPGEVGFVHASFEEFLGAEHIGSWPFSDIESFVQIHAGEGRWRNVITYLLSRIQRRDEFDRLIVIIESPESDELARFHRIALLGDIAFGAATWSTATTKRLAQATMQTVESEDWLPARREALASMLKGLADPTVKADVELRLNRWLPARLSYRESLIEALGTWPPTSPLQAVLYKALHDEDRGVQRAAAAAYAKVFSPSTEAFKRLLNGLAQTRNLATAAALLESLAHGWSSAPEAMPLFEEAWRSHGAELCLVGILGLAKNGLATDQMRDAVLRGQNHWSDISYQYHALAASMLMKYWPGDDSLIEGALMRAKDRFNSIWEHDIATSYLLESPVDRTDVRTWIVAELGREHAFNFFHDRGIWSQVGRFAAASPEIRAAANAYWCDPKNHVIGLHMIPAYVTQVADHQVADALIRVLSNRESRFNRYWALTALLAGWGRDHPVVKPAIDALADGSDEDLNDLASLIPEIMSEKLAARERLIRMSKRQELRRDLLTAGLEKCGCDATDQEAVAAILAFPEKLRGTFEPSSGLFETFGAHADVRKLGLKRVLEADGPLAAIAVGYAGDSEFRPALFAAAVPLPIELRTQIVEFAAAGAPGTALEAVLAQGMLECDPELRARMVIAHHNTLPSSEREAAQQALIAQAVAIGPHYESIRSAALAGLATIGALDVLVNLEDNGKLVGLETKAPINGITSVERLVCEKFADFEVAFGDQLSERFESRGNGGRLAEILSVAPSASPAARAAFLRLAESGKLPRTPKALRAFGAERPGSAPLLTFCLDTLDNYHSGNDRAELHAEVGLVLRNHFTNDADVRMQLVDRYRKAPGIFNGITLAVFAPDAKELEFSTNINELDHRFGDWMLAVQVAAWRADSEPFCKLLEAMVMRRNHSQFDAQRFINMAVEARLHRDSDLVALLSAGIRRDIDPSICGSFARYLASAGMLRTEARGRVLTLLQEYGNEQRLPIAGYDAMADQWRSVRATLLDAISTELELV
jgi:hypothetical protein